MEYLRCSIISVSIISKAGDDVLVLIKMAVHGPRDDAYLGILFGHSPQTLGAAHEVQEENISCLDTFFLKYFLLIIKSSSDFSNLKPLTLLAP